MLPCLYSENYKIEWLKTDLCLKRQEGCQLLYTGKEAILVIEITELYQTRKNLIEKYERHSNT